MMDRRAIAFLRDLAREGPAPVVVRGHCMEPAVPSGSEVSVRARRVYLPGDVIIFRSRAGVLAAHRVLGWRPGGLVTKGDRCESHDSAVSLAEIIGAVDAPIRFMVRVLALRDLGRIVLRRLTR